LNCSLRYLLLSLFLLQECILSAQSAGLYFENYSSDQGLSQNSCYTIAQDADGFMWFGTQDGLNRYDGKQFRVFLPQNEIGKKLPSNYISSLYFDAHKNLLWVGTIGGVCIYDPKKDLLIKVTDLFPTANELGNVPVKKIVSFKENEYWIVTYNRGLLLFNAASGKTSPYFNDNANRAKVSSIVMHDGNIVVATLQQLFRLLPEKDLYRMDTLMAGHALPEIKEMFSYDGKLWIGTLSGGCFYIDKDRNIKSFPANASGIGCFVTDSANNLWIGTRGSGIVQYDKESSSLLFAAHDKYDNRSLGKNFVLSLFRDRQGIIWCGLSGSGIAKYDPLKYQFKTLGNEPTNPNSLPDNMVFDIYKASNGNYYVGTQNKGFSEYNPVTGQFYTYSQSSKFGMISNTIYDIAEDNDKNMWIASWGGLMKVDMRTKQISFDHEQNLLTSKKLYSIIKLKNADSLFITSENGPVFYSLKEKKWKPCADNLMQANAFIGRYVYEDDQNVLWICTVGAGLVKYDYKKQKFEIIEPVKKYAIYARHLLPDGNLFWIATDNGIVLYNYVTGNVEKRTAINGANASNVCYAVMKDNLGYYWVSTNTGLYRIRPQDFHIKSYDLGNGLSFLEYNTACALKESNGSLLFGGVGGITHFNPQLLKENTFSPLPLITGIDVNYSAWHKDSGLSNSTALSFTHKQNFLTIHFAVTNFSNQNKNSFAYRMEGLNENWINSGNRNFATYTSLPHGEYTFQLKSANSDGKWSAGITSLKFIIHPPWWQTWWFRVAALLTIAGIITFLVRRRIKSIRHEAELKQQIAETEMMALRAQMNPHFIFNCINSIDALIQSNDKYQATVYLNKFAKLIRNILDSSKQNTVSLTKDLQTLQLYIDLEQLRNENKFKAEIRAEEGLLQDDYKVPPLIVQPYVENAILHGLRNRMDDKGELLVSVSRRNNGLEYIIEDNGVGMEAARQMGGQKQNKSYGMQMSQDRVKLFNKEDNASVLVTNLNNNGKAGGTKVQVLLKID
jgi:ligand-binding sensor domain-containing protein/anti-sigma regulatory factor (Ser/Thr protein kinase)